MEVKEDDVFGADERHFKREVAKPLGAASIVTIMLSVDALNPVKIICNSSDGRISASSIAMGALIVLVLLVIDQAENLIYWGARVFFRSSFNNIFFKSVEIVGAENVPKKGPIILTGNHNNQFVDGIMLLTNCHRDICFMIAEKSWKRPFVGFWARVFKCIPVSRAQDKAFSGTGLLMKLDGETLTGKGTQFLKQVKRGDQIQVAEIDGVIKVQDVISDTECAVQVELNKTQVLGPKGDEEPIDPSTSWESGTKYKVVPKIDQSAMYAAVHQGLGEGQCLGIFPEGGSHDRTDLLPLKAGVAIIALDAFRLHKMRVPIIPVGLNYYRGHRFRGRVVIEFGAPEYIPDALYSQYETDKRPAIEELLGQISTAMRSVIVPAPDYKALQIIYMVRRIYVHEGRKLTAEQTMDLNRRFAAAYRRIIKETDLSALADQETQTHSGTGDALATADTRGEKATDDEPSLNLSQEDSDMLLELRGELENYCLSLKRLGIRDHQVSQIQWRTFGDLVGRILYLSVCFALGAIPQIMFNLPVMMLAQALATKEQRKALSNSGGVKLAARDVVMSYAIMYCLCFVPILYCTYAVLLYLAGATFRAMLCFLCLCPLFSLFGVKASEQGVFAYTDMLPMILRLSPAKRMEQDALPAWRYELRGKVRKAVKRIGPRLGDIYYGPNWSRSNRTGDQSPRGQTGDEGLRARQARAAS